MIRCIINIFKDRVFVKFYLRILIDELWNVGRIESIFIREIIKHDSTLFRSTVVVSEMMKNMIFFMLRLSMNLNSAFINTCSVNSVAKVVSIRCGSKVCLVGILPINIFEKRFSYWALIVVMDCLLIFVLSSRILLFRLLACDLFHVT